MTYRILILTDVEHDARLLEMVLAKAKNGPFKTAWLQRLGDAVERIAAGGIDAVLMDLSLSDSDGIDSFEAVRGANPQMPIMILSATDEEPLAIEAVDRGAQGYLSKGYFQSYIVPQGLRNITQRKAVEEALFKDKARAEITLNSISDAVIGTDVNGNVDYLNIAAEKITGWSREDAAGRPVSEIFRIINGVTRETERNTVQLVLQHEQPMGLPANTLLITRSGGELSIEDSAAPIYDGAGELSGAVIVFRDVSATRAMTEKMAHLAHHDFLTQLPNRFLLTDRLTQAIANAQRNGHRLGVLFLDLDNFKHINDSLGHATGDAVLQSAARRLIDSVRSVDTVSRQGGDEFVVLLLDCADIASVSAIAEKILAALALPHSIGNVELYVTTSIGISLYPDDGTDADELVKKADTAMYQAKQSGRNNYQFFRDHMNAQAVERQLIETSLHGALARKEFGLHYQPRVDLATNTVSGVESLLRWTHPQWGELPPDRFLTIAEECGLILPIGRWVLREACAQAARWISEGLPIGAIAVNISSLEFRQKNFAANVEQVLNETGLTPGALELEITESTLMANAEASVAVLVALKALGVRLAVDHFGNGYSSLTYLNRFPIDALKIDRSLIHEISSLSDDGFIVSAVIGMGRSLRLKVIAEGVENATQLAFLKARSCEMGQGCLFGRPMNAAQFSSDLQGRCA